MKYRTFFIDMDGVLWRGNEIIYENLEEIKKWERDGKKIIYMTNNSTKTRNYYIGKLKALDLNPKGNEVLTSAYVTAQWLKRERIDRVFLIGEEGLFNEISSLSIFIKDDLEALIKGEKMVEAVVVGMDRNISYEKLWAAQRCILRGAIFLASNTDRSYPVSDGPAPGGGAIVAAIEAATLKSPDVIIGKPHAPIFEEALKAAHCQKEEILVIGDRVDTDILGAKKMGIDSLLVLTGITGKNEIPAHCIPNYIVPTLKEFSSL